MIIAFTGELPSALPPTQSPGLLPPVLSPIQPRAPLSPLSMTLPPAQELPLLAGGSSRRPPTEDSPLQRPSTPLPQRHGNKLAKPPRKRSASQVLDVDHEQPAKRLRSAARMPTGRPANLKPPPKPTTKSRAREASLSVPPSRRRNNARLPSSTNRLPIAPVPTGRRKFDAAPPTIEAPPVDENASEWFKPIFALFSSKDFGPQWTSLVSRWALFEKRERYCDAGRLETKHRPTAVGEWIKRARSVLWRPVIKDISAYEEDCRQWWTALQPAWRVSNGVIVLDKDDGDWEKLRRPGVNGIVGLVAALFFWAISIEEQGDDWSIWNVVVMDCNRVFIHLLS